MKEVRQTALVLLTAGLVILAAGCEPEEQIVKEKRKEPAGMVDRAVAQIFPTEGYDARGTVLFEQAGDAVRVVVSIAGVQPGKHGFHLHTWGDCSAKDAASAGGHYAPRGMPHAGPEDLWRHVGDFGNVTADSEGRIETSFLDSTATLNGPYTIVGRSVVLHNGEDDLTSQPSGDAGPRIGCGVIGVAPAAEE